jgi:hypothetical protein
MSIEITAIKMSTTGNSHEHIVDVQWRNDSGGTTQSTREAIIEFIDRGNSVHVQSGAQQVPVGVVRPSSGAAYIRTYADRQWTNNLLSLPRFY